MDMQHMHTHIHNYQLLNTWKELEPKQDELLAIGHSFCLYYVVYIANYLLNLRLQVSQGLGFKGEFISDYPMYQGICSIFCTESDTFFFFFLVSTFHFPRNSSQEPRPSLSNTIQRPQLGPTANLSLEMGSGQLAPR